MNVDYMREQITKVYPGDEWARHVQRMPERQVMAIYYRILEETPRMFTEGRFAYAPDKKPKEEYHQMTIFEWNQERRLENERKGITQ